MPEGYLRIWTITAGGTLPVQGVPVQIREENGNILHVLRTGESGLTPTVALPAPPAAESLTPNGTMQPYTPYYVTVELSGYQPVRELVVPIFDGITSLQPITLLPAQSGTDAAPAAPWLVYPQIPYQRLRQGAPEQNTRIDDPRDREGRRPIANTPDSEDISDRGEETMYDDNDLPEYGRGRT